MPPLRLILRFTPRVVDVTGDALAAGPAPISWPGARANEDGGMEPLDPELLDAVLSLALAAGNGDEEAVEIFLRAAEPADLAVTGAGVIWRMAAALGRLVQPERSAPQMIHVFAAALKDEA